MTGQAPHPLNDATDAARTGAPAGRIYSGLQSSERALERHGRLVEAGLEVFGTTGYPGAKIKSLCQGAGLSERYFYESFESREQLLMAVYDQVASDLMRHVMDALQEPGLELRASVRAGMAAVVNFMLDDPRHARIILVEIVGVSPDFEAKRHKSMSEFAAESMRQLLLLSGLDPQTVHQQSAENPQDIALATALDFARLTAVSMVGGVNNMLLDAVLGGTTYNTERITDVAFQLIYNASTGIRALAAGESCVPAGEPTPPS
ncbi:TetR/AcrR family transcriptional regulator [Arthrobacter sp. HY1533]|uniref:TetR/AcrR family transcriptional regulator n=1 Tax=Arthrobacter sp. HY1533 TaxID=2970919 RepID=UPI0022B9E189|nr:TetR/AcrR family transcriptional regulator [Arthrobacter sp. HY1533]